MISCSQAVPPAQALLTVDQRGVTCKTNAGTIEDHVPTDNIPSFGMCESMQNPAVQDATAAAMGNLTPAPCVPVTDDKWTPGASKVTIHGLPALHIECTCQCKWQGTISVVKPGNDGTVSVT